MTSTLSILDNIDWLISPIDYNKLVTSNFYQINSVVNNDLVDDISNINVVNCEEKVLDKIIDYTLFYMLSSEKRMYLNFLDIVLRINRVSAQNETILLRDVFKAIFEEIGIEIEFCGKGANAKGVIIEYDSTYDQNDKCSNSKIAIGNTLIKINEEEHSKSNLLFKNEHVDAISKCSEFDLIDLVKFKTRNSILYSHFNI